MNDAPTSEPDFEFDALITTAGDATVPCDVLMWLPHRPEDDAKIEITLRQDAQSVDLRGVARLHSAEHVEKQGLRVEVDDLVVKGGTSNSLRSNAARLTLGHIGRLRIERLTIKGKQTNTHPTQDGADYIAQPYFQLMISSLSYGSQHVKSTDDCLGHRNLEFQGAPKSLRFHSSNEAHVFELQRRWRWKSLDKGNSVYATSAPVLVLATTPLNAFTRGKVSDITRLGEDACALLSLAARHRVVPHVIRYGDPDSLVEEWLNPLNRHRGVTEEEAMGPLVDQTELEAYFERATSWWIELDSDRKDAVRLAIFGVNRLSASTMESDFMGKFAALEGLAKRWGTGNSLCEKCHSMLHEYHVRIGGLWPLFETYGGEPLYWLRNEIAHGRTVTRFSGALPLATDHLQLWLEHILLALMSYIRRSTSADWLSAQVPHQTAHVETLRRKLREQSQAAKAVRKGSSGTKGV